MIVQKEGNRELERNIEHYNLDMIISIGYRVNSFTATKFRQWATKILKNYIQNGFEKYSKQYDNITLKIFQNAHDRFLIIDKKEIYHIGASLKDLGKSWFAFSKINLDIDELIKKLN